MNAISLFSNCGAGDIGFKKAGFSFKVLAELEAKRLRVAKLNHPKAVGVEGDLRKTWVKVIEEYRKKCGSSQLQLMTACPPCQGFSSARGLRGQKDDGQSGMFDERNTLSDIIPQVALELLPRIIVIENVTAFLYRKLWDTKKSRNISAANMLIENLADQYLDFVISSDLSDFGIPQSRKRSVMVFIHKSQVELISHLSSKKIVPFPKPIFTEEKDKISISKFLDSLSLPKLDARTEKDARADDFHELHNVPVWDSQQYKMISNIPPASGKSAWQNNCCSVCNHINNPKDVFCSECNSLLSKPVVKEEGNYRLIKGFGTSYKRMSAHLPAPTVLTVSSSISSHNTIHPNENRTLSALECQYIQTFPNDFDWGDTLDVHGISHIRKMIGEAVPPKFTEMHGRILYDLLKQKKRVKKIMKNSDVRVLFARKNLS